MKKSSPTSGGAGSTNSSASLPLQNGSSMEPERETEDFSQQELGQRLRDARRDARLTLQQLSHLSGYSVTHLSQVERGHACPTIGALRRITGAIGRDIRSFLELSPLPDVSVVRREERRKINLSTSHTQVELATTGVPGGELQAAVHVVRPFAAREPARPSLAEHARSLYILKGKIELVLDGQARVCEPGMAVHLSPQTPIAYRNLDQEPCEMLVISTGSAL